MLVRGQSRLCSVAGLVFFIVALVFLLSSPHSGTADYFQQRINDAANSLNKHGEGLQEIIPNGKDSDDKIQNPDPIIAIEHKAVSEDIAKSHLVLSSKISRDGTYFPVRFGDHISINPNVLPHPNKTDTYLLVAQQYKNSSNGDAIMWFTELVCDGIFKDGIMQCNAPPMTLPIAATTSSECRGQVAFFNYNIGPHDARVFWGPEAPYIIYGSQSKANCFGQWIHDFRRIVDWSKMPATFSYQRFFFATDMQRPPPYGDVEKNWFVFWDNHGEMYIHYDTAPRRSFSKLEADGSAGPNLASDAAEKDAVCMDKHMPLVREDQPESIHQATNSLAITMCKRSDPTCHRTDDNTFIFQIFQYKSSWMFHSMYEPYLMVFNQAAPFEVHGISSRPLWIKGRGEAGGPWNDKEYLKEQSQQVYVTSMAWKDQANHYHGYLDDELFLGFGIEDSRSGAIDVLAGDLMKELALC